MKGKFIILIFVIVIIALYLFGRAKAKKRTCAMSSFGATIYGVPMCRADVPPLLRRKYENECELTLNTDAEVQACVEQKIKASLQ